MADMIKFFKGLEANLPAAGTNGALYITTDEGAIYLGTGTGMKRLGDFIQVANVAALPEKAHESCLYYCVAENILAKWNGTEWKQINKQPTADELKVLLGLGAMAYKSEVAEGDLNADLKAKVNAAAEGNHSHDNKALLDTYTQTEANLADAVAKKHAHTFVETELNKIADGDVAKWNAVVADHLTAEDKTALENAIKEAKKAGTDANTALETYKVANDARVLAVEEDIAEIVDGTNGVLAQAKAYSDGKLATARTEISAEIDADVKVVNDALEAYKTANDAAVAGVKATADAAAVKTEVETALAGKVDKVDGKDLIATSEIERLATLHNYDDTQVRADISKKADAAEMTTELGKKVDKVEGFSLVSDTEIARLAGVHNYDDEEVRGLIGDNADAIEALSGKVGTVTEGKTVVEMIADAQAAATYDDEEVRGLISDNADAIDAIEADYLKAADKTELSEAIGAEKTRAEGIEAGLRTDVDAIKADYLKAADKTELQGNIDTVSAAVERLTNGVSAEEIDGVNDLIEYVKEHGPEVVGMKKDISDNAAAIAAEAEAARAAESALSGRIDVLAAIDHDAYIAADTALKNELNGEIAKKADASVVSAMDEAYKAADIALSNRVKDLEDNKAGYATTGEVATAKGEAIAAAKTETETQVSALAETLYTKEEVDALIEAAHTWGSF